MAWTPFSAEAVELKLLVLKLEREGRVSEATDAVVTALERAYRDGPSDITYEQFEAALEAKHAAR